MCKILENFSKFQKISDNWRSAKGSLRDHLGSAWGALGERLGSACVTLVEHLGSAWGALGERLGSAPEIFWNFLIFSDIFWNFLKFSHFFGNFLIFSVFFWNYRKFAEMFWNFVKFSVIWCVLWNFLKFSENFWNFPKFCDIFWNFLTFSDIFGLNLSPIGHSSCLPPPPDCSWLLAAPVRSLKCRWGGMSIGPDIKSNYLDAQFGYIDITSSPDPVNELTQE